MSAAEELPAWDEGLDAEAVGVRMYRRRRLLERGLSMTDARLLAEDPTLDLHDLLEQIDDLKAKGCATDLLRRLVT